MKCFPGDQRHRRPEVYVATKKRPANRNHAFGKRKQMASLRVRMMILVSALCLTGMVLTSKVTVSNTLLAPVQSPSPLPLSREYIHAGAKLVATEEPITAPNSPPAVSITSPANNHVFASGSSLLITVSAGDADGTINQVQLYQGAVLLGTASGAGGGVYNFTWNSVLAGTYALTAKATDNANAVTTSPIVNVTATASGSASLSLNGTTAYADAPNSATLNITGPITVEAWIKINVLNSNTSHDIVSRINRNASGSGGGYALTVNAAGKARLDLFQSHNQYTTVIGATVLGTGVWHHVAGVFDGIQMRVYVNGVLDGTFNTSSGPASGSSLLRIGKAAHAANAAPLFLPPYYFPGLIDEVRVTAATAYTANFTPAKSLSSVAATRGLWKFNQSPVDSSGNNNNCLLQGGATYSTIVP